jgi:hypothetical protein
MYYYTYAYLREDGTPYYVGKGKGRRVYKKRKGEIGKPIDKSKIIFLKQNLTEEEAFKHEIYMIAVLGRKDLGTGILRNKTNGGEGASGYKPSAEAISKLKGRKPSEETIKKIKEANKDTWTKELKKKMSDMKKGIPIPEERKKKISLGNMGKVVSEETKQKLREHNVKYLYEITSPEENIYTTDNLNHFCKMNELDTAAMQRVCSGKQKSHTPKRKDRVPNVVGWTVRILAHIT